MDQRTAPVSLIDDALGWQDLTIGATLIYILPSTSPNAAGNGSNTNGIGMR